jgi:hypothetical protein
VEEGGAWNFKPYPNMDQSAGKSRFSFQLKITDDDGDTASSASQTIEVVDSNYINAYDNLAVVTGAVKESTTHRPYAMADIWSDGTTPAIAGYNYLHAQTVGAGTLANGKYSYERVADFISSVSIISVLQDLEYEDGQKVSMVFQGQDSVTSEESYSLAALRTQPIQSSGGKLSFDWIASGGSVGDVAIYILFDENGVFIKSGLIYAWETALGTGTAETNRVRSTTPFTIDIPPTMAVHDYTVSILAVEAGTVTPAAATFARFYVSQEMNYIDYVADPVSGNVLNDASPDGLVDETNDSSDLVSVSFGDVAYTFVNDDPIEIVTGRGTLMIEKDGDYTFTPTGNGVYVDEVFTYTIADAEGHSSSAELHVKYQPSFVDPDTGEAETVTLGNYVSPYADVNETTELLGDFRITSGTDAARIQVLERAGWITSEERPGFYGVNTDGYGSSTPHPERLPDLPGGYQNLVADQGYLQLTASLIYSGNYGGTGYDTYFDRSPWAAMFNVDPDVDKGGTSGTPAEGTADRKIIDILFDVGVEANPRNATNTTTGDYDRMRTGDGGIHNFVMNFVGKNFDSTGGTLMFSYVFDNSAYSASIQQDDAAYWFIKDAFGDPLRDADGKVVGGCIQPAANGEAPGIYTGIATIDVPYTVESHKYTLVVGAMHIGGSDVWGNYEQTTILFKPPVLINDDADYVGNVLNNSDLPEGLTAWLSQVTFNNVTETFSDADTEATFEVAGKGTLVINRDGDFKFFAEDGVTPQQLLEEGTFKLVGVDDQEGRFFIGDIDNHTSVLSLNGDVAQVMEGDIDGSAITLTLDLDIPASADMGVQILIEGDISVLDLANLPAGVSLEESGANYAILDLTIDSYEVGKTLTLLTKPNYAQSGDVNLTFTVDGAALDAAGRPAVTLPTNAVNVTVTDDDSSAVAKPVRLVVLTDDLANASVNMRVPNSEGMQTGEQVLFGALTAQAGTVFGTMTASADGTEATFAVNGANSAISGAAPGSRLAQEFTYTVKDGLAEGETGNMHESDPGSLSVLLQNQTRSGDLSFSDNLGLNDYVVVDDHTAGNILVSGGGGEDTIIGGTHAFQAMGGAGNDSIVGGEGDDQLYGNAGNDAIYGGGGNDTIEGGTGDDILFGEGGSNTLYGGRGADTFAWRATDGQGGKDTIMDFDTAAGDKLSFNDLLDNGEPLNVYLQDNISGEIALDRSNGIVSFKLNDGTISKDVEIHFDTTDQGFHSMVGEYNGADNASEQQTVLMNFIISISTN